MIEINIKDFLSMHDEIILTCCRNENVIKVSMSEGNVVMLSEQNYNNLIEKLYLLGIPNLLESIVEGVNTPLKDCRKINW